MTAARVLALMCALFFSAQNARAEWSPVGNWNTGGVKTYALVAHTSPAASQGSLVIAVHVCITAKANALSGWLGLSETPTANAGDKNFREIVPTLSNVREPSCYTVVIPRQWKAIYLNFQDVDLNKTASGTYQVETTIVKAGLGDVQPEVKK